MHMTQVETWIRERAYSIWEMEGRPEGCEQQHWERATRDVMSRGRGATAPEQAATQPGRSASKASTGKAKSGRSRRAA